MSQNDFTSRSKLLGHEVAHLRSGETVTTQRQIHSIEDLRNYLSLHKVHISKEPMLRLAKGAAPQNPHELMQHVMDFAAGNITELAPGVAENIQAAFPLTINEHSAPDKHYGKGENLLAQSLGGIQVFNFGTVTVEDGGWLTVRNTNVLFSCDRLILNGAPTGEWCDINILGVDAPNAEDLPQASPTGPKPQARSGWCEGLVAKPGDPGETGKDGNDGATGNHARKGLPSLPAEFRISKEIISQRGILTVLSRSGAGGKGGKGQKGGKGGTGGKGGDGSTCGCGGSDAGNGGAGGKGGRGGNGGNGSDGVDAQGNITIAVPEGWVQKVKPVKQPAKFGAGGARGEGGEGGDGGAGGTHGKNCKDGNKGGSLGTGGIGDEGHSGTYEGKPGEISVREI